jgi:hypothetical protein
MLGEEYRQYLRMVVEHAATGLGRAGPGMDWWCSETVGSRQGERCRMSRECARTYVAAEEECSERQARRRGLSSRVAWSAVSTVAQEGDEGAPRQQLLLNSWASLFVAILMWWRSGDSQNLEARGM